MTELVVTTPEALQELLYGVLSDFQAQQGKSPAQSWMTAKEAAEYLRVKPATLHGWVSNRTVPFSRAGGKLLFSRKALDDWLSCSS